MATLPVLNPGVQFDILAETTVSAGTSVRDVVIQSDAVLTTLSVTSITGTLDVTIYALVGDAESLLYAYPTISGPLTLDVRRSDTTTSTLRIRAQYSGACTYRVQCRAVAGGESDAATAANQAAEIALLTAIESDTSAIAASVAAIDLDTTAIASSVAAIEADTSAIAASVAAIDADTSAIAASVVAIEVDTSAIAASVAAIDAGTPAALGQTTMSASMPVVIASNQTPLSVTQSTTPWIIAPVEGQRATYSAAVINLVMAASPTDIFTITGSNTKTLRILRVEFSGTQTTNNIRDVQLVKRSTANANGTASTLIAVPHDSTNTAATAVVRAYTANPTLGTLVGPLRTIAAHLPSSSGGSANLPLIWDFGDRPGQAVVLRGTSEVLALNMNTVTSNGNEVNISIEWTEE